MKQEFTATFYGVRGTVPLHTPEIARFGGNTSCVALNIGKRQIVLDAGSGLYFLGQHFSGTELDILLSHTHIDHILGLMFFEPLYRKPIDVRLWAGHLQPELTLRPVLERVISPPIFPINLSDFKASIHCRDFVAGEALDADHWQKDNIRITTLPLHHPDRATGYRVEHAGHSVCYITDIEHMSDQINDKLVAFVKKASVMIYDGTYDDNEFDQHIGWGHSTWQQAARISEAAGVEKLVVFHHHQRSDDTILAAREQQLQTHLPNACFAREGMTLKVG